MTTRDTKGLTPQDRSRKGLSNKITMALDELPQDRETVLMLSYISAHAMRLAIDLEARIAEGETNT